jgi:hypothetical protein
MDLDSIDCTRTILLGNCCDAVEGPSTLSTQVVIISPTRGCSPELFIFVGNTRLSTEAP